MRTETKEIKIYSYEDILKNEELKQKILKNYHNINIDYDWYHFIFYDAESIGMKIKSFDLDRAQYCNMEYINYFETVINKILSEHGKQCETYKTAKKYLKLISDLAEKYSDSEYDIEMNNLEVEFKNEISECYYYILEEEYNYRTSEEGIFETIQANEYEFTEDGNIY